MQSGPVGIVPGTVVAGQYRVEAAIGEGGYGAVYAATQLNLGRRVALKVLHPDVITRATALQRFRREAELAQGLAHPNTVRLFDFGEAYGRPYIAYEFLDGRSLEATLAVEGRLAPQRVARIAAQTLKALMEAHAKGIVHRDIKPGNLFICNFAGEPDFVKVLDFGIASARSSGGPADALTQEGTTLGTPAYMAPEQALALELDGRADLYSVGLVMAEALSGRRVFAGTTAMEILIAQASDTPAPLPPEVLASPLGGVIRVATEKARDRRFPNAGAMLAAVESVASSGASSSNASWSSGGAQVVVSQGGAGTNRDVSMLQQAPTTAVPLSSGGMPVPQWATSPSGRPMAPSAQHGMVALPNATVPGQPAMAPRGSTLSGSFVAGTAPPIKAGGSAGGLIAAIVGVVLLVVAGVGGWALYTYSSALDRSRHARTTADKRKTEPTTTKRSDSRADDDDKSDLHAAPKAAHALPTPSLKGFSVKGKSAQDLLTRMEALRWKFLAVSELDLGWGVQSTYTYEGADDTVAVLKLARTSSTPAMGFAEPGMKTVRDGEWFAELTVTGDNGPLDAPMDELFSSK